MGALQWDQSINQSISLVNVLLITDKEPVSSTTRFGLKRIKINRRKKPAEQSRVLECSPVGVAGAMAGRICGKGPF